MSPFSNFISNELKLYIKVYSLDKIPLVLNYDNRHAVYNLKIEQQKTKPVCIISTYHKYRIFSLTVQLFN